MRKSGLKSRRGLSLVLCLLLLLSTVVTAFSANALENDDLSETGASDYYLWGESTNGPSFSGTTPTGKFSYDSNKGYYYYDLKGASNDYCFVISQVSNSAAQAQQQQAVTVVAGGGKYYVSSGNYGGKNCLHLWNPSGDDLRLYFTSPNIGLTVVELSATDPTTPPATTPQPTSGGNTNPTTVTPTSVQPTSGGSTGGKNYVYCENEAGWGAVYAYMWNSESDKNAAWPGVKMTNTGGNTWRYQYTKSYSKIIFNIGSNQTQTSDLNFPGDGYCFNNKTSEWSIYDDSPLQISSFTTDVASPQYNGVAINVSAAAEGKGTVYYKFSVTGNGTTSVLSDFSTRNSVQWIPQTAGTYTITYDFKDAAGNTNQRVKSFVIEDGSTSVAPYIKTVSPSGGELQNNVQKTFTVSAGGGKTGTNLLFYKYTVKDASGNILNVPYYTRNTSYSYKPTALGDFTVTVSVQGSDNKVAEQTYSFTSVGSVAPTEPPATAPAEIPTQASTPDPTEAAPVDVLYGDADDDGVVAIFDVTWIQRFDVGIDLPKPLNSKNADVDADGYVNIFDATLVQRYIAGIISTFPAEH